jgi:hypothetical protein
MYGAISEEGVLCFDIVTDNDFHPNDNARLAQLIRLQWYVGDLRIWCVVFDIVTDK